MRILIVNPSVIPALLYGGTERVIWDLGKELVQMGHAVTYLVKKGSHCDFAKVRFWDESQPLLNQIPPEFDLVHFNVQPEGLAACPLPYVITIHGNVNHAMEFDTNTIFVSQNHAARFGSTSYVHNGLDWSAYSLPDFAQARSYFHFLGHAAWRVKNVKGAIDVIRQTPAERLRVLGGVRFNINMGLRFTFSPRVRFHGMVGGAHKERLLNASKGLVFPVRWQEPFGLAIIESLYYGCPVFGTPYGSLPELVPAEVGFLSASKAALAEALAHAGDYVPEQCHAYVRDRFSSKRMADAYLQKYEQVLAGQKLNAQPPMLKEIQTTKFLPWQ